MTDTNTELGDKLVTQLSALTKLIEPLITVTPPTIPDDMVNMPDFTWTDPSKTRRWFHMFPIQKFYGITPAVYRLDGTSIPNMLALFAGYLEELQNADNAIVDEINKIINNINQILIAIGDINNILITMGDEITNINNTINNINIEITNIWNEINIINGVLNNVDPSLRNSAFSMVNSFVNPFNSNDSVGLKTFFCKETGYYLNLQVSKINPQNTIMPQLEIYDRVGNFMVGVNLIPFAGNVIGNIQNYFVEFDRKNQVWYLEIGCDNETLMAFKIPFLATMEHQFVNATETPLGANDTNTPIINITEFTSLETFNQVIGSDDTAIPSSAGTPDTFWYGQKVCVLYNQAGNYRISTGTRQDLYASNLLTPIADPDNLLTKYGNFIESASADFFNNILIKINQSGSGASNGTQILLLCRIVQDKDTNGNLLSTYSLEELDHITQSNTDDNDDLYAYTNRHGSQMSITASDLSSNYIAQVQILNLPSIIADKTKQFTVLITTNVSGYNEDLTTGFTSNNTLPVVFINNNSQATMFKEFINAYSVGNDIVHLSSGFRNLAHIRKQGFYTIANTNYSVLVDTPEKQNSFNNGKVTGARNIFNSQPIGDVIFKVGQTNDAGFYKQTIITFRSPTINPTDPFPFSTATVVAYSRLCRVGSVSGQNNVNGLAQNNGFIGRWVYEDWQQVWDRLDTLDNEVATLFNTQIVSNVTLSSDHNTLDITFENLDGTNQTVLPITLNLGNITNSLQAILNNLQTSGAISSSNVGSTTFNSGHNLATGNINLFGGVADGNSFIRTNSGNTENDIVAGI